jgi:dihydrofolate reductase
MHSHPSLVIVAAMSRYHQAIGNKNALLWHLPADLKHFKELTLGHPVIMGRKTFESILSILGKPLPGRTNIVVTRDTDYKVTGGAVVTHSLDEAIAVAESEDPKEIHIGGGAELYRQVLPEVSRLHITWVDDEPEADTFFPEFLADFEVVSQSDTQQHDDLTFQWIDYVKKSS